MIGRRSAFLNVISGRRFTESDIPGVFLNADYSVGASLFTDTGRTTPVAADGDAIAGQFNLGGSVHPSQSTAANRPLYKVAIQNGLSVALFDGVNDYLNLASFPVPQNYTIFVVGKTTQNGTRRAIDADGASRYFQDRIVDQVTYEAIAFNTVGADFHDTQSIPNTNFHLFTMMRRATDLQTYVDSVSGGATATTGTPNSGTFNAAIGAAAGGGGDFWAGYIGQIVMCTPALDDAIRVKAESLFRAKWGLS